MLWIFLAAVSGILLGVLVGWLMTIGTRRRLKHAVRLFKSLLLNVPSGLFYQDLLHKGSPFVSHALQVAFALKTPVTWQQLLTVFTGESKDQLDHAYRTLMRTGSSFSLFLQTKMSAHFIVRGCFIQTPKQQGLLISFQDVSDLAGQLHLASLMEKHKNILAHALDSLSFPLFIRDTKGMTFFANPAVNLEKADTLNDLNWLSLPFVSDDNFYTLTYGQSTKTEEELNRILANMLQAQRCLCNNLPCAVCLFNAAGQLMACSPAFAELWHLDKQWIQSEPSYEDYWDVVQDNGLLSRVADFADYKKQQRENFACLSKVTQLFLYLPDGKIIRRTLIPSIQGCVILLDENQTISQK